MANYILTLQIDPNQLNGALKKFQHALWGGTPQAQNNPFGKLSNVLGGLSKMFGGGAGGKLAAFGLMSIGIGELVKLGKGLISMLADSSPMLKAMLGLLNTGIMFMLRPIGDFIGFILRPILLVFLRYIALPFYRYFAPIMQRYGTVIGEGLAKFLLVAVKFFQDPAGSLKAAFDSLPATIRAIIDIVFPIAAIADLLTHIPEVTKAIKSFIDTMSTSLGKVTTFFTGLVSGAFAGVQKAWDSITGFFTLAGGAVKSYLAKPFGDLIKFFVNIGTGISGTLTTTWIMLTGFFGSIAKTINGAFGAAWADILGMGKLIYNAFAYVYNAIVGFINLIPGGLGLNLKPVNYMARGGIINEPVLGIGQRSGKGYMLGESGAEMVTPLNGGSSGGDVIHIHFHAPVYGVSDLETAIMSILQKNNSRRRRI